MIEEGYIKFNCRRTDSELEVPQEIFSHLCVYRDMLYKHKWIGCLENGIGYGNISHRSLGPVGLFYISGSATGGIPVLNQDHYSLVNEVDIDRNSLFCTGRIDASSESMSHAAIYMANSEIMSVIHIHDAGFWKKLLNRVPTTPSDAEYGTPELALSIKQLVTREKLPYGIIALAGHEDGIISYGRTLEEAYHHLQKNQKIL